jgi:hypothetical protein
MAMAARLSLRIHLRSLTKVTLLSFYAQAMAQKQRRQSRQTTLLVALAMQAAATSQWLLPQQAVSS